jgi:hypothetical protein
LRTQCQWPPKAHKLLLSGAASGRICAHRAQRQLATMADAAPETYEERLKRRRAEFLEDCEESDDWWAKQEEKDKRHAGELREAAPRRRLEHRRAEARAEIRAARGGADWQPERHIEPAPESPPRDATDGVVPSESTASAPSGGSSGDGAAELSEKLEALRGFFAWFEVFLLDPVIKAKWEAYATIEGDHGTIHDYYRKARGLIDESSGSA